MQNVDLILKNLKIKLGARSDADLVTFFDVKPGTISAWRSRNSMNFDLLIAKCSEFGFDLQEIILGVATKCSQSTGPIPGYKPANNNSEDVFKGIINDLNAEIIKLSKEIGALTEQNRVLKQKLGYANNNLAAE
jgi:hypothetical protein